MKTVSVNIENLCAACHCSCRHCLLNSRHKATGVEYARGEAFARSFYAWMKEHCPEKMGMYYVGYCMDFPEITRYISYFREQTGMDHLMFDGVGIRNREETTQFLREIRQAGIGEIHLTFYGTEAYHDRFAGRKGDFAYMMQVTELAHHFGLKVSAGIMLTRENKGQMDALFAVLADAGILDPYVLLPHAKGRGEKLSHLRLTDADWEELPEHIRAMLPRDRYKTEAQWLEEGKFPEAGARHLTLSLTPDNIERLESMDPGEIIRELEAMDDAFYAKLPDMQTLAQQYGQRENRQLFRYRDWGLQLQKRYMKEHPIYPDMTDERYSFSTRIY